MSTLEHNLLTISEASAILRVSKETIRRMCCSKKLAATHINKQWRIKRESVLKLL